MHVVDALVRFGGVASRAQLLAVVDRGHLERALSGGEVVRDARGAYALPTAHTALRAAAAHHGVVSHQSAAAAWGWEQKSVPDLPHLTVPRNRNVPTADRRLFVPHWATLHPDEVVDRVTTPERTMIDCLRSMTPVEAMCLADSGLRSGAFDREALGCLTRSATGPGSAQARRTALLADRRAANPFESTLRWIALGVPGLDVVPQVVIDDGDRRYCPDLVDVRRRIVLEADSATWHTSRAKLRRDCRRYNRLVLLGWLVLRFAWEDVMFEPDRVRADLLRAVERAHRAPRSRLRV